MLVTSQLPVQTTNIFYSFFHLHLCPPTLKKVPQPMVVRAMSKASFVFPKIKPKCDVSEQTNLLYRDRSCSGIIFSNAYE